MRAMVVIPSEEGIEFPAKALSALRDQNPPNAFVLHAPDEAFDDGNATVLPSGVIPRTDSFAPAPALEISAPEDLVLVADQVLGRRVGASDRFSKKSTYGYRVGRLRKEGEARRTS